MKTFPVISRSDRTNMPISVQSLGLQKPKGIALLVYSLAATLSSLAYSQSPSTAGKWQRQVWNGIAGGSVSALTSSPAFYQAPSSSVLTNSYYTSLGDNYGARTRGYITPTVSGIYTFWISGDDETQLFLSPTSSKWASRKIAGYSLNTGLNSWDVSYSQRSAARYLKAGEPYFVEMLHKEGAGSDFASVSWAAQEEIVSSNQNWALPSNGAVASASSSYGNQYPASRAIDGDTSTYFLTNNETYAWWTVDLRQDRMITSIYLVNRVNGYQDRMANFRVSVEDASGIVVTSKDFYVSEGSMGAAETWLLPQMVAGRKVRIAFLGPNRVQNYMNLAEVRVNGPASVVKNWCGYSGVVASQSTDYSSSYPASAAIDGNISSFNHTANSAGSWWQVDLGADRVVDTVELINRQDAATSRLSNFRLSILDNSGAPLISQDFYLTSGNVRGALRWELPSPLVGRKVRVDLLGLNRAGDSYLHIAEVNVWGRDNLSSGERGLRVAVSESVMSSYDSTATDDADDDGFLDSWEAANGFAAGYESGNKAALADPDGDLRNNLKESLQGTNPFVPQGEPGYLSRSAWTSMHYYNLSKTRGDVRYFLPAQSNTLQPGTMSGTLSSYSAGRIRGEVTPAESGYYRFWISSGDAAELWLSTVEGSKYHKQLLCAMSSELGSGHGVAMDSPILWDNFGLQMSREIYLEAGKHYYLESDYQLGHSGYFHVSIAWAKRGGIREPIPSALLNSYVSTPDDQDDDFLPDTWESQYGLNPLDAGGVDNSREGEFGDFDGDGLSNREEFVLNTNPANVDTDGDGESDLDEVRSLGTNALVADSINDTPIGQVDLSTFHNGSTAWTMTSGGLLADCFRGEASWNFTVPSSGFWLLRLKSELMGSIYGNEKVPVVIKVDGKTIASRDLQFGLAKFSVLQALTPYLTAGNHQVTIQVNNMLARRTVALVSLDVLAPANPGSLLARDNRLSFHAAATRTSPLCIEGYSREISSSTVNNAPVAAGMGDGHWYVNVPLSNLDGVQSCNVVFEQGHAVDSSISWQGTNVLEGESLVIRQGDSLRAGAWSSDASTTATITSSQGTTFSLTGAECAVFQFPVPGVYTLSGVVSSGMSGTTTVKVVASPNFSAGEIDALDGESRTLSYSSSPEVAFEAPEDICTIKVAPSGATGVAVSLLPYQPRAFGLVARLGNGGPILGLQRVNVIGVSDAMQNDLTSQASGDITGYKIYNSPLTVTNLPAGGRVDVSIFRAGVMFRNGSTLKSILPQDLTNGWVNLEFLFPIGVSGGYCHVLKVYDRSGTYIGSR